MKKTLILLVLACLGLGSGIYVAHQFRSDDVAKLISENDLAKSVIKTSWMVTHPQWSGKLVATEKNRLQSELNGDQATILSNKDGLLTVKWDRWGEETFQCNDKNVCTLK